MNSLCEDNLILEDTNKNLVKNQLVLITCKDTNLKSVNDLMSSKVKHIATGEPKSVPAGKYTDEALTSMKIKDSISEKLVFIKDVKKYSLGLFPEMQMLDSLIKAML